MLGPHSVKGFIVYFRKCSIIFELFPCSMLQRVGKGPQFYIQLVYRVNVIYRKEAMLQFYTHIKIREVLSILNQRNM